MNASLLPAELFWLVLFHYKRRLMIADNDNQVAFVQLFLVISSALVVVVAAFAAATSAKGTAASAPASARFAFFAAYAENVPAQHF